MFRRRFRQWWREEGLITVIVLAVCVPLMCSLLRTLAGTGTTLATLTIRTGRSDSVHPGGFGLRVTVR
jgi:hypothetical protein